MLFRVEKDWKQLLVPEDEERLNEILRNIAKHRGAYRNASDVRSAQLWCVVLELRKEIAFLHRRLKKIEYLFEGMIERVMKREEEKVSLIESLDKF